MVDEAEAQATALRLAREVRDHKRASRRHRDRARELRQQLDALVEACEARGFQVHINAQPIGGHSGNQEHIPAR